MAVRSSFKWLILLHKPIWSYIVSNIPFDQLIPKITSSHNNSVLSSMHWSRVIAYWANSPNWYCMKLSKENLYVEYENKVKAFFFYFILRCLKEMAAVSIKWRP